ncbi:MAG TPA: FtsX-like permease family protein [Microthrixaceae bacterium]|nr:FtsX-like permease family protein [Microthrixaceae bacterium]
MTSAVALWVRAEWRRRRLAVVGLTLLVGIAGGLVLAVVAGARRTSTSLERFTDVARSGDVLIEVGEVDDASIEQLRRLPMVADAGLVALTFAIIEGVDSDLALMVPLDDRVGDTVERDRLLRGRRAEQADEVVVNETTAELAGVDAGDRVQIATMTPEQVDAEEYFPPLGPQLDLEVVGITRAPSDLIARPEGAFVTRPEVWAAIEGRVDRFTRYLSVRLKPGASEGDFVGAARDTVGDRDLSVLPADVRLKPARDVISALAIALVVVGVAAAVAAMVAIGMAIVRHVASSEQDLSVVGTLGMTPAARLRGVLVSIAPIAFGGAVLAAAVATAVSPATPIGLARDAEPSPGVAVDWSVIGLGALAIIVLVAGSATVAGSRALRPRQRQVVRIAGSRAVAAARRSGAGPAVETGVRFALERGSPALPVRSAIGGCVVAVLGAVAALTFAASLDRLVETPARWGATWDVMLNFPSDEVDQPAAALAADERLEAAARWDAGSSFVGGEALRAYGLRPLRGDMGFSLSSGRQPRLDDEVVIGPETASRLEVAVGDTIDVARSSDEEPRTVRVVGIGLFPELDEGNFSDAIGYYGRGFEANATVSDLFEASQVVVRFDDEARAGGIEYLQEQYPAAISGESVPLRPGSIGNLAALRTLPYWLTAVMATLGIASLVNVLATTRRRRRVELATLRCLGLTPPQTAGCIVSQSLTIGAVAVMIGIPAGLIVGGTVWFAVAEQTGVATDVARPVGYVVVVSLVTMAVAGLTATFVARRSGASPPARWLRAP